MMNVDPNGLLDIRTRDIANSINAVIVLIPYLGPLQKAMRSGVKKQVKKLMDKSKVVDKLTRAIYDGLVTLKVKTAKARDISKAVASFINVFVGYSIGQAVVFVLKKKFKTINKKKKMFYFIGTKKNYEYIRF